MPIPQNILSPAQADPLAVTPLGDDGEPMSAQKTEDFICELGAGQVPPEIEEALKGASPGEDKTVAVKYPDDFQTESLAGREVSFVISVKDVRQKRLPSVDDDFAKACGPFETLLDLRVRVRTALEERAKSWARSRLEEEIVREIIEAHRGTVGVASEPEQGTRFYFTLHPITTEHMELLSFEAEANGVTPDQVIAELLALVPVG